MPNTGTGVGDEGRVPDVREDPKARFRLPQAAMGGLAEPVRFTDGQIRVLKAASDELIPPGEGFPAPSEVGVIEDFLGRYITPGGQEPTHFPFASEDDFKAHVNALGEDFLVGDSARRVATLKKVEQESSAFFSQLLSLVYYGYYSRPQVIEAIRTNLVAGRDYHGPPQPYGYLSELEQWDDSKLPRGRGTYIQTADVKPAAIKAKGTTG
jgi:hypothetical protein